MLKRQASLWITKLILSCRTTIFLRTTSREFVDEQLLVPVSRSSTPGWLGYNPPFLCVSWPSPRNGRSDVTSQVFCWIKTKGLGRPLCEVYLFNQNQDLAYRWACLGSMCFIETSTSGIPLEQLDLCKYYGVLKMSLDSWSNHESAAWE